MKKTLTVVLLVLTFSAQAQQRQAKQAVEKSMEEKHGNPGKDKLDAWMNGQLLNVKVEPSYSFPVSVTMHMTNYSNGEKKKESDIRYFFNTPQGLMGTSGGENSKKKKDEMFMIYDYKANAMIMLNVTDKTGMAMNLNAIKSKEQIEEREHNRPGSKPQSNTDCSKTGKIQTIQGYKCEEYVCIDKERNTRGEIWVTRELKPTSMSGMRNTPALWGNAQAAGGMLMAGKFFKNGELDYSMEVTELNTNADYTVNTGDYTFEKF